MDDLYVVYCPGKYTNAWGGAEHHIVGVYSDRDEAQDILNEAYYGEYLEKCPTAGDRMEYPFEQFVRENPGRYLIEETHLN